MKKNRLLTAGLMLAVATEVQASHKPQTLMERIKLVPEPREVVYHGKYVPFPASISISGLNRNHGAHVRALECLEAAIARLPSVKNVPAGTAQFSIRFRFSNKIGHAEGYRLDVTAKGATVLAKSAPGALYGAQTLCQILAYAYFNVDFLPYSHSAAEPGAAEKKYVPLLTIKDQPHYRIRSFMIDPGRAPFTVPLIKRTIRIMASLKLNTLHVHLFDDQLCGFRFETLPLGGENPYALTPAEFREIVRYARSYHISVMPELESWGHVQSLVYHYPELYGSPGMWGGASFAIGEKTYALLEKVYDEIIALLENEAMLHVGLDEALWAVMLGEEDNGHTPTTHVARVYNLVQKCAKKHKKKITVHLWADHGGRPLPAGIRDKVVIEPWKYRETDEPQIIKAMKQYGGKGKTPVMMGAGISSVHYFGDYEATRIWCREGLKYPNVLGVTICHWENNDLAGKILALYGGANFAWTPETPKRAENDPLGENLKNLMVRDMRTWQVLFPDADPNAINADRGPEVASGKYVWPPMAGKPVAPTAGWKPPAKKKTGQK